MKFFKTYTGALVVLAAVMVLSIPLGCLRSVNAQRDKVLEIFAQGAAGDGHSVSGDLQARVDVGKNLLTLARRYPQAGVESQLSGAVAWAEENAHPDAGAFPEADDALGECCARAVEALRAAGVSERDEAYLRGFEAELNAAADRMRRDGYNAAAGQFNERVLGGFPASVLRGLRMVKEIPPVIAAGS